MASGRELFSRSIAPDSAAGLQGRGGLVRVVLYQRAALRKASDKPPNITTELFVDLITASALGTMRFFFTKETYRGSADPPLETLCNFVVLFFPLWWASYETMVYMNRFRCGDCSFNLYVLGFVIIVVMMNNNLTNCKLDCALDTTVCTPTIETLPPNPQYRTFALLKAGLFFWTSLPYVHAAVQIRRVRLWCQIRCITNMLSAVISIVASTTTSIKARREWGMLLVTVQLIVEYVIERPNFSGAFPSSLPAHLGKRMAKFTLMVLAQSVGSVNQPKADFTTAGYAFTVAVLFIALDMKILYFDLDRVNFAHMAVDGIACTQWLWLVGHLLVAMSLIIFGSSASVLLVFANSSSKPSCSRAEPPSQPTYFTWLFCSSFAMVMLVSSGLLLLVANSASPALTRGARVGKKKRAMFRMAIALLLVIVPLLVNANDNDDSAEQKRAVAMSASWSVAALLSVMSLGTIYMLGARSFSVNVLGNISSLDESSLMPAADLRVPLLENSCDGPGDCSGMIGKLDYASHSNDSFTQDGAAMSNTEMCARSLHAGSAASGNAFPSVWPQRGNTTGRVRFVVHGHTMSDDSTPIDLTSLSSPACETTSTAALCDVHDSTSATVRSVATKDATAATIAAQGQELRQQPELVPVPVTEVEEKVVREAAKEANSEIIQAAKRNAEQAAKCEVEEVAQRAAETKAKREAEEQAQYQAEEFEKSQREDEEKAKQRTRELDIVKREAEKKSKREAEEKSNGEVEVLGLKTSKRVDKEKTMQEAEGKAKQEVEELLEKAKQGMEIEAKRGAQKEGMSQRVTTEKAECEAEKMATHEVDQAIKQCAEETTLCEAEETSKKETNRMTDREVEEKSQLEAEDKARHEASLAWVQDTEESAKSAAAEKVRQAADKEAQREAEETDSSTLVVEDKTKREAEEQAKAKAEENVKREADTET